MTTIPTGDVEVVDVAVIGGGMAGVSVAAELVAAHSVALLEQEEQLAYHATGRSAAAFLESYGSAEVRALTRASRSCLEHADDGRSLLSPRPLLLIATGAQQASLDAQVAAKPRLQMLGLAEAQTMCPVLRADYVAGAAVEPDAQDIDVAALHQMYVARARRAVPRSSRPVGYMRRAIRPKGGVSAMRLASWSPRWS